MTAMEIGKSSPAPASIAGVGAMFCAITPPLCNDATTTMAITVRTNEPPNRAMVALSPKFRDKNLLMD
ncbi:hypothetical protein OIU77_029811 [Salix suchowensis]|uniref:Uncharacterized protein n=1 Tax=Salix suchowensis TaxID=1278906 RepID=A0ABQ9BD87_9ROSI|nr:hypothetical protein OIU77_029811 [Salix suchowensis]